MGFIETGFNQEKIESMQKLVFSVLLHQSSLSETSLWGDPFPPPHTHLLHL